MARKTHESWFKLERPFFLTEAELAERWRHSTRSLQRWRASGDGPRGIRIGRRVVYRLRDIEAFEAAAEEGADE